MKILTFSLSIAFAVISATSIAQVDTIRTEEIEIVKTYTPFIEDGKKLSFSPTMPVVEPNNRSNLDYSIEPQFTQTSYEPDEIKPLPIDIENEVGQTNFYLKGGYGNMNNPLAQFAISGAEKNNFSAGVLGNFQALKGDEFADQKMSNASLKLFGTKEVDSFSLDGDLHFNQYRDWLYGYDHNLFTRDEDDVEQTFNNFGGAISAQSIQKDEYAFAYELGVGIDAINDKLFDVNETVISIGGELSKQTYSELEFGVDVDVKFRNSELATSSSNDKSTVVTAIPSVGFALGNADIYAGVSLNNDDDFDFKVFPHLSVEVPFSNEQFTYYASWKGKTIQNSYLRFVEQNPRFAEDISFLNTTKEIRTPAGVKGVINDKFGMNISVSQEITKNAPLYSTFVNQQTSTVESSKFSILYEPELINWKPNAAINYQFSDKVNALANLNYNIYDTELNAEAWHLPKLEANLDLQFHPLQQLTITSGFEALTGIEVQDDNLNAETLSSIFDLDIGAEYQINKNFGVFIQGNNITNQEYQRWKNYQTVGANFLAGVVFSY